jgi:hypothetical protein
MSWDHCNDNQTPQILQYNQMPKRRANTVNICDAVVSHVVCASNCLVAVVTTHNIMVGFAA